MDSACAQPLSMHFRHKLSTIGRLQVSPGPDLPAGTVFMQTVQIATIIINGMDGVAAFDFEVAQELFNRFPCRRGSKLVGLLLCYFRNRSRLRINNSASLVRNTVPISGSKRCGNWLPRHNTPETALPCKRTIAVERILPALAENR